jgi:hypothetical protein
MEGPSSIAVVGGNGDIYVAWREEGPEQYSFIATVMRKKDGTWTEPLQIGNKEEYASTPSLVVTNTRVFVSWIGWEPGFLNSNNQENNRFPEDDGAVEGTLYLSHKSLADVRFSSPVKLTGGTASCPNLAINPRSPSYPSVVWTEGRECPPGDCIQLFFSDIQPK